MWQSVTIFNKWEIIHELPNSTFSSEGLARSSDYIIIFKKIEIENRKLNNCSASPPSPMMHDDIKRSFFDCHEIDAIVL